MSLLTNKVQLLFITCFYAAKLCLAPKSVDTKESFKIIFYENPCKVSECHSIMIGMTSRIDVNAPVSLIY